MAKILWINSDGGGFPRHIQIADNMSVSQFFGQQMPDARAEDYEIRVNRQPIDDEHQILRNGDRVSMTPTKHVGAAGAAL